MELVANVWPVMDGNTGFVLRFLARAYALEAPDEVISATLKALAPTDFRLARAFPIPQKYVARSQFGDLAGCVHIRDFHAHQSDILEAAFRALESDFGKLQGVGIDAHSGAHGIGFIPRFPDNPYLLVTTLHESDEGQLQPFTQ